jgi:hypothetical protein
MTTTPANSPVRLYYIDDSGAEATGWVVYSWIETSPDNWRYGLRQWLDMRRDLYAKFKIPPSNELHATKLANGRGNPSTDPKINGSKAAGRAVMQHALAAIQASNTLEVGTVYRQTSARGRAYHRERQDVYAALIAQLDLQLEAAGQLGIVFMDGNGNDSGYNNAHRQLKLATRRIIEDTLFQPSHTSQWIQMADITAWVTYQSLLRHAGKRWAWNWYDTYLAGCDVNGGPTAI